MLKFILKRLLEAIPTLLVLITVSFFMMRFAPGNPFTSERALPPEVLANIEAKYGLDKPIGMQYLTYLGNLVQGDLGPSFKYKDFTVNDLVSQALPVSAKIGSVAFLLAVTLGVTFGTIAALKTEHPHRLSADVVGHGRGGDPGLRAGTLAGALLQHLSGLVPGGRLAGRWGAVHGAAGVRHDDVLHLRHLRIMRGRHDRDHELPTSSVPPAPRGCRCATSS